MTSDTRTCGRHCCKPLAAAAQNGETVVPSHPSELLSDENADFSIALSSLWMSRLLSRVIWLLSSAKNLSSQLISTAKSSCCLILNPKYRSRAGTFATVTNLKVF